MLIVALGHPMGTRYSPRLTKAMAISAQ